MLNKIKIFCIVYLFLLIKISPGQNYIFKHLGSEDGISQSNVLAIIQDNTGFIWLGAEDGLYQYDGYNFKAMRSNPSDSVGLVDNYIGCLLEFGNDIWIGTGKGLAKYNKLKNTFSNYANNKNLIGNAGIADIIKDKKIIFG